MGTFPLSTFPNPARDSTVHFKQVILLLIFVILNQSSNSVLGHFETEQQQHAVSVLSNHEQNALNEFRALVDGLRNRDFMKSDGYLIRWLRANDFDVWAAYEKFVKSMDWRRKNNMDQILHEDFSVLDEMYPYSAESSDKDGRPVIWAPFGTYDIRKIAISGKEELYQRFSVRMYELLEIYLNELRREKSPNITQFVAIFDLGGFNMKSGACFRCLEMIPELVSNYDDNYPNLNYKAFLINTPKIFQTVINIGKNFMSERTRASLLVFDYNKLQWSAALLEQIDADQLPIEYGGTKPSWQSKSFKVRNDFIRQLVEKAEKADNGMILENELEDSIVHHELLDDLHLVKSLRLQAPNIQMDQNDSVLNITSVTTDEKESGLLTPSNWTKNPEMMERGGHGGHGHSGGHSGGGAHSSSDTHHHHYSSVPEVPSETTTKPPYYVFVPRGRSQVASVVPYNIFYVLCSTSLLIILPLSM